MYKEREGMIEWNENERRHKNGVYRRSILHVLIHNDFIFLNYFLKFKLYKKYCIISKEFRDTANWNFQVNQKKKKN